MTSKRLFLNLIRQDQRNRMWLTAILSFVEFLLLPVIYLMELDSRGGGMGKIAEQDARLRLSMTESFFGVEPWILLVGVSAFVAAVTGFSWLCSQKKIDYYHAMPIKREGIFFAFFTSGWMIGTIPFAAADLIAFYAVGGVFRQVTGKTMVSFWKSLLILVLFYLAVYAITVLAMVMTGRIVIGVLFAVMIEVYVPLCVFLYGALMERFDTYWSENISWATVRWTSPPIVAVMGGSSRTAVSAAVLLLYAAAAVAAGVLVYRFRPSETAGSAYMNPRIASVIKVMVSIPSGIVFASLFNNVFGVSNGKSAWTVVWALTGAVLADIVMELIQRLDPSAIIKGWRSALVIIGAITAVMVLIVARPFDYDQYLPSRDGIAEMGFACIDINEVLLPDASYSGDGLDGRDMVSKTLTSDFSEIYKLAEAGKKYAGRNKDQSVEGSTDDSSDYSSIVVAYRKNSGRLVYRSYRIPKDTVNAALARLSKNEAFRKNINPANRLNPSDFNQIDVVNWMNYQADNETESINLTPEESEQFTDAVRKDMSSVEFGTLLDEKPLLSVTMLQTSEDYMGDVPELNNIYVYPQYENTLAFLRGKGYEQTRPESAGEIADTISSVQVYYDTPGAQTGQSQTFTDHDSIVGFLESVERTRREQSDQNVTVIMTDRRGGILYPDVRIRDDAAFQAVTGFTK